MSSFLEKKLIIIPFDTPKSWSCDYIMQTANILCKKNTVIAFLWADALSLKELFLKNHIGKKSFGGFKKDKGILYFNPIHFFPFKRFTFIANFNLFFNIIILKILISLKGLNQKEKIIWLFQPDFWWLPKIFGKSYFSLYDCVDFFTSTNKKESERLKRAEIKLLKKVDIVFTNSHVLYENKIKYRQDIHLVPQGFSLDIFKISKKIPANNPIFKSKKPIIGYIGGINYRLDYPLLINLVKKNRDLNFFFIGYHQKNPFIKFESKLKQLKKLRNAYFIENQPRELLMEIVKHFDICSIPYNVRQEFNKFCYPMKVFEYFYLGKPVISTLIEELKRLQPYVKIVKNSEQFTKEIKKILNKGWPKEYVQKQRQLAIANSWVNKIRKIDQILIKYHNA